VVEYIAEEPAVYNYAYAVADEYSGTKLSAEENRDEYKTVGSYQVFLKKYRLLKGIVS
jgi:hypothetical protein